ncbi:MAG: SIMPL domain-containing protein, partial [Nitrososphaerota archaeon]|nr:SIMPL domain-containing protein [Nitrososphaerota archaeon]
QVIDTAVKAGANQVSLYFGATGSQVDRLESQALAGAVAAADIKAQTIAGALGVSITGVVSANDESGSYYPQQYYGLPTLSAAVASVNTPTPIMPGTQTFSMTVQVVYSI